MEGTANSDGDVEKAVAASPSTLASLPPLYASSPIREDVPSAIDNYGFYIRSSHQVEGASHAELQESLVHDLPYLEQEEAWWVTRITTYLGLGDEERCVSSAGPAERFSAPPHSTPNKGGEVKGVPAVGHRAGPLSATVSVAQCRVATEMRRRVERFGGAPHPLLRRLLWGFFSGSAQRTTAQQVADATQYAALVEREMQYDVSFSASTATAAAATSSGSTGTTATDVVRETIQRDLSRTFPTHCLFTHADSFGQQALHRILLAYRAIDSEVGYCQGMGFVVGVLLLHAPEEEAFSIFRHLMQGGRFRLRELYLPGFPLLRRQLHALRRYLRRLLPVVSHHFTEEGVELSFFASQWFMTLFAFQFPMDTVCRVWDLFLTMGWSIMTRTAVALLEWEQEALLVMDMEQTLLYLKQAHAPRLADELIYRVLHVPVLEESDPDDEDNDDDGDDDKGAKKAKEGGEEEQDDVVE